MHIIEGYLPWQHALAWTVVTAPFVAWGGRAVASQLRTAPETKSVLGAAGGFCFLLSALKLPSFTGSCSHPTGAAFGSILFGPPTMAVMGTLVLVFQAVLLAHGGLTTLGANAFSLAVVGPWVAYLVHGALRRAAAPSSLSVFVAAFLADLATYLTTAGQLALAHPDPVGGFGTAFGKFSLVFAITQVPLAIVEGLVTAALVHTLSRYASRELASVPGFRRGLGAVRAAS